MIDNNLISKYQSNINRNRVFKIISDEIKPLVLKMAWKRSYGGRYYEDMIQCGWIGVHIALLRFDISRDVKFITYAYNWIKSSMIDSLEQIVKHINTIEYIEDVTSITVDYNSEIYDNHITNTIENTIDRIYPTSVAKSVNEVLKLRYLSDEDLNDREISEVMSISRSRVQKIISKSSIVIYDEIRGELDAA